MGTNVKPDDDTSSISEGVVHMTITITGLADAGDAEMNQIQDQINCFGGGVKDSQRQQRDELFQLNIIDSNVVV